MRDGGTPLHLASSQGYVEVVQALLDHPSGVTTILSEEENEWTLLHFAAVNGYTKVVQALL